MSTQQQEKAVLFVDGSCPLCRFEARKLAKLNGRNVHIQDINELPELAATSSHQVLFSQLHLKTASGQWLTGLDANIEAWQGTRYGSILKQLQKPPIKPFVEAAYYCWLQLYRLYSLTRKKLNTGAQHGHQ
jgi:predicted DCC family thiol-disulfide oxidoreductase YuxK